MTGNSQIDSQRIYLLVLLFEKDFSYSELFKKYQKQFGLTPDSTFSDRIKFLEKNHFIMQSKHQRRINFNYAGVFSYILKNKLKDYKTFKSILGNSLEVDVNDKRLKRAFRGFFRKRIIQGKANISIDELLNEFIALMGKKDYGTLISDILILDTQTDYKRLKNNPMFRLKIEQERQDLKNIVNDSKKPSFDFFGALCYFHIHNPLSEFPEVDEKFKAISRNLSSSRDSDKSS